MNFKRLVVLLAMTLSTSAMAKENIPAGIYTIDSMHSKIGFEVPHLVISTVEGRFETFEGEIEVKEKIEKSKVKVNIDTASISTAVDKRDEHLKSADFFDAAKYPKISFESKTIVATKDGLKVTGKLKIKKETRDVTLDLVYAGKVKDGYGQEKIAFTGKTQINRKDFGITYGSVVEAGPVIGDKVTITLTVQAAEKAPVKK